MPKIYSSPWGRPDNQFDRAPGLVWVSTPSHGGFYLDSDRWSVLTRMLPGFKSWAGANWLEEDCDASAAVLCWPELFKDQEVYNSWYSVHRREDIPESYWALPAGQEVRRRAWSYAAQVTDLWECGGMCSMTPKGLPRGTWSVSFRRHGERREVFMSYPRQQHYTDAELAAYDQAAADLMQAYREQESRGDSAAMCQAYFPDYEYSDADPGL